ncbi:HPr family phosphocarrier protein [Arthrobacter sp. Leaf69]|uniref:HPr family phosphocarrier protein n=1 Tax=Arthrobacter sp. Leaf69 TaxID=1736232 RepID=UPI0019102D1B|nr:HPr family phosphocarrier protein [Arthrobacter sp. Leaf69]
MPVRNAIVKASIGLHARPAALFVRAVHETGLPVTISKDGRPGVDARSLLEVMTEDFHCGCTVELAVSPDAGRGNHPRTPDGTHPAGAARRRADGPTGKVGPADVVDSVCVLRDV